MAGKTIYIVSGLLAFFMTSAALAEPQATNTTTGTTSNGSSTGVGNAGSFGIASGTSNSTSSATSNGYQYSGTDNSVDNSLSIKVVSEQELKAVNVDSRIAVTGSGGAGPSITTGSASANGGAFANYSGVLNNGWNTAPAGNAQAATNIAVNGNLSQH